MVLALQGYIRPRPELQGQGQGYDLQGQCLTGCTAHSHVIGYFQVFPVLKNNSGDWCSGIFYTLDAILTSHLTSTANTSTTTTAITTVKCILSVFI